MATRNWKDKHTVFPSGGSVADWKTKNDRIRRKRTHKIHISESRTVIEATTAATESNFAVRQRSRECIGIAYTARRPIDFPDIPKLNGFIFILRFLAPPPVIRQLIVAHVGGEVTPVGIVFVYRTRRGKLDIRCTPMPRGRRGGPKWM
jgi:hypothetical protein